jgi:RNA polymerase sigma-70 factor (ECF subfamily)
MTQAPKPLRERFYRDLRPALIAFFTRRVGSRVEAEDLVHDVYVRLASTPDPEMRDPQAYVFQVAANLVRDRARRAEVRTRYLMAAKHDDQARIDPIDPHRIAADRETLAALVKALDALPERTRRIFLLYRYEQVSRQAIADTFGISMSAVDKHVHKAVVRLSARLGGSDD